MTEGLEEQDFQRTSLEATVVKHSLSAPLGIVLAQNRAGEGAPSLNLGTTQNKATHWVSGTALI